MFQVIPKMTGNSLIPPWEGQRSYYLCQRDQSLGIIFCTFLFVIQLVGKCETFFCGLSLIPSLPCYPPTILWHSSKYSVTCNNFYKFLTE